MLGAQPEIEIVAKENSVTILNHKEGTRREHVMEDPLGAASDFIAKWRSAPVDGLPDAFCGNIQCIVYLIMWCAIHFHLGLL
jgi:anthranilate synthase component 1